MAGGDSTKSNPNTITGRLKDTIRELDEGDGVRIEYVIEELSPTSFYASDLRHILEGMERRGEVYCPREGWVRVTP